MTQIEARYAKTKRDDMRQEGTKQGNMATGVNGVLFINGNVFMT